jgi:hypothetical protein
VAEDSAVSRWARQFLEVHEGLAARAG